MVSGLLSKFSKSYSIKATIEYLNALRIVLGDNGVITILRDAGLLKKITSSLSRGKRVIISYEEFSALNYSIERIYGSQGLIVVAHQASRKSFLPSFHAYDEIARLQHPYFQKLSLDQKLYFGLLSIAQVLEKVSDQHIKLEDKVDYYKLSITDSVACYHRTSKVPICYYQTGLIRGGLEWITHGLDFPIHEQTCIAKGDAECGFFIRKKPFTKEEKGSGMTSFLTRSDVLFRELEEAKGKNHE